MEYADMGDGQIDPARLAEELRPVRHNTRNLISVTNAHQDLIKEALTQAFQASTAAASAKEIAHRAADQAVKALDKVIKLDHDIYGDPARRDDFGLRGELLETVNTLRTEMTSAMAQVASSVKTQATQNKWVIGLLITVVLSILAASVVISTAVLPHK